MSKEKIDKNYSIKILKSIQEVEEIRHIWEEMQWHPNADIDFYLTVVKTSNEIISPFIIVIYDNYIPKLTVIGRLENTITPTLKLGYKTLFSQKVLLINFIYGGHFGEYKYEYIQYLIKELNKFLRSKEADIVIFNSIDNSSKFFLNLQHILSHSLHQISEKNIHWYGRIPMNYDEFIKKIKKSEKKWVRMPRKLEMDFHSRYSFEFYDDIAQIKKICEDSESISKVTYKRGLGVGFYYNEQTYNLLKLSAKHKWLRAYFLYIEGVPFAFLLGLKYQKKFILYGSGHKPDLYKYRPGIILFFKMVDDLIKNTDVDEIDFGFGDAHYKRRFGTSYKYESSVTIYSKTFIGIWLFTMQSISYKLNKLLNNVIIKLDIRNKIKKYWRKKLTKSTLSELKKRNNKFNNIKNFFVLHRV